MSCKVIHRDFHALALFEFAQGVGQQIKVESIRVIEVVVVAGSQSLLFWGQDLRNATMLELLHSKLATTMMLSKMTKSTFLSKTLPLYLGF